MIDIKHLRFLESVFKIFFLKQFFFSQKQRLEIRMVMILIASEIDS